MADKNSKTPVKASTVGHSFRIEKVPEGERRAGMYTLKINGKETKFYSSTEEGITRTIRRLMNGPIPGSVKLTVIKPGAKIMKDGEKAAPSSKSWEEYETLKERVNAFMTRGTLGKEKQ